MRRLNNWPNETVDEEHNVPIPKWFFWYFCGSVFALRDLYCFSFVSLRSRLLHSPLEPGQQNLRPRNHLTSKEI